MKKRANLKGKTKNKKKVKRNSLNGGDCVDIDEIMKLRERMFDLQEDIDELSDLISQAIDELSSEDREELEALVAEEEDEEEDEEDEDEED